MTHILNPNITATPVTHAEYETLLDSNSLFVKDHANGRFYRLRRNGATRHPAPKRRPSEFITPIKVGYKGYGSITDSHFTNGTMSLDEFARHDDLITAKRGR